MRVGAERYAGVAMRLWCALVLLAVGCAAQENTGSISGAVIDPTGAGISGTTVTLSGSTTVQVRAADQGKFAFSMVEPGVYKLKFQCPGFREHSLDVTINHRPLLLGDIVLNIAFEGGDDIGPGAISRSTSPTGGNIYGVVRQRSSGVAKAVVILQLSGKSTPVKISSTDALGNFQFNELKAGVYDLLIEANGFKTAKLATIRLQDVRDVLLPPVQLLRPPTPIR